MNNKRKGLYIVIICMTLLMSNQLFAAKSVMVPNVPLIKQYPQLPTGCEATALTMLLQYHGVAISKEQVARDMPKASRPVYRNGKLQGESPNKAFIGDPFSKNGFGIFSPPIFHMINTYLPGRAEDLGGGSFDKVYKALDEGRPVMVWTTIGQSTPSENSRWYAPSGELVIWKVPEHAVVAVGYDDTYIYINDPYTGTQRRYKKSSFVNIWEKMGRQALAVKPLPPKEEVKIIEKRDAQIEGIQYPDLIIVDEKGEWIPLRVLEKLTTGTVISYNHDTTQVTVDVKGDYPIPDTLSKWIPRNTQGKLEAIPRNINGKYAIEIELLPTQNEIITYNTKGRRVIMSYQIVDGAMYVDKDWAEKFYELNIQVTKESPN